MPGKAKQTADDGTLTGAVAQRQEGRKVAAEHLQDVEAKVNEAIGWFRRVVPSHVNADQYVGMAVGELRLKPKLAEAAYTNPTSLMVALSECARLGLIPGDTYHLTFFWNTKERRYDIVGMTDYSGEVDLMYRSGGVASVHCQVVRAEDRFYWQPSMVLPEHEIGDDGLAEDEVRGPLRAVYAYARLTTGGISDVAMLNRGAVMRARAKAKTMEFWGPEWPEEGPNTVMMWRKTSVHRLWNWVPHSAEFIAERLRASAMAARYPEALPAAKAPAAVIPLAGPKALNGPEAPAGPGDTQPPEGASGTAQTARGRGNRGAAARGQQVHAEGCVRRDNHAAPEQCEVATVVGHAPEDEDE